MPMPEEIRKVPKPANTIVLNHGETEDTDMSSLSEQAAEG